MQEKILRRMEERGLTQADLARLTKLHPTAVSRVLRGEQRLYVDQALRVAIALDLPLDYLADDSLESPPPSPTLTPDEDACLRLVRVLGAQQALQRLANPSLELLPPRR